MSPGKKFVTLIFVISAKFNPIATIITPPAAVNSKSLSLTIQLEAKNLFEKQITQ